MKNKIVEKAAILALAIISLFAYGTAFNATADTYRMIKKDGSFTCFITDGNQLDGCGLDMTDATVGTLSTARMDAAVILTTEIDTLSELNAILTDATLVTGAHTTDTNANTICVGTNVYLDGEGNCDTVLGGHTDGTNAGSLELCLGVDASGNCEVAVVDDAEVNGSTNPISSNALFDHDAIADAHFAHAANLTALNSQIGASIADGAHTTDTSAQTACAAGQFLEGDGSCTDVLEELELDTLTELNTQLGTSIADGAHTSALAASAVTAGSFPTGSWDFSGSTVTLGSFEMRPAKIDADICSDSCAGHAAARCQTASTDTNETYISTGTAIGQVVGLLSGLGACN